MSRLHVKTSTPTVRAAFAEYDSGADGGVAVWSVVDGEFFTTLTNFGRRTAWQIHDTAGGTYASLLFIGLGAGLSFDVNVRSDNGVHQNYADIGPLRADFVAGEQYIMYTYWRPTGVTQFSIMHANGTSIYNDDTSTSGGGVLPSLTGLVLDVAPTSAPIQTQDAAPLYVDGAAIGNSVTGGVRSGDDLRRWPTGATVLHAWDFEDLGGGTTVADRVGSADFTIAGGANPADFELVSGGVWAQPKRIRQLTYYDPPTFDDGYYRSADLPLLDNSGAFQVRFLVPGEFFSNIPNFRSGVMGLDGIGLFPVTDDGAATNYHFNVRDEANTAYITTQLVPQTAFVDGVDYALIYRVTQTEGWFRVFEIGNTTPILDVSPTLTQAPVTNATGVQLSVGQRLAFTANVRHTGPIDAIEVWDPTYTLSATEASSLGDPDNNAFWYGWPMDHTLLQIPEMRGGPPITITAPGGEGVDFVEEIGTHAYMPAAAPPPALFEQRSFRFYAADGVTPLAPENTNVSLVAGTDFVLPMQPATSGDTPDSVRELMQSLDAGAYASVPPGVGPVFPSGAVLSLNADSLGSPPEDSAVATWGVADGTGTEMVYKGAGLNGKPAVWSDNDRVRITDAAVLTALEGPFTIMGLIQMPSVGYTDSRVLLDTVGGPARLYLLQQTTDRWRYQVDSAAASGGVRLYDTPLLLDIQYNGADNWEMFQNGVAQTDSSATPANQPSGLTHFDIRGDIVFHRCWYIWPRVLSAQELADARAVLAADGGITLP